MLPFTSFQAKMFSTCSPNHKHFLRVNVVVKAERAEIVQCFDKERLEGGTAAPVDKADKWKME